MTEILPIDRRVGRLTSALLLSIAAITSLAVCPALRAQNNEWELMNGGSSSPGLSPGAPGIYGTFQTPAPGNTPGGRQHPVTWTDQNGNLWLFGGVGCDAVGNCGALDDLWEYFPTTNEWAWMAGDSKMPGAYQTQEPVYGTYQTPATGNTPGARDTPVVWADQNGNLWLFGGFYEVNTQTTTYYSYLNDLWEFNTTVNQWAWMGGSSSLPVCGTGPITCDHHGVYGTLGIPAPGNVPGGRHQSVSWTDTNGDVWLFGGLGADSTGVVGYLNDLWEFNPSTSQWAWMGGSNTFVNCSWAGGCGTAGVYGTKGQPGPNNIPGGRAGEVKWTDNKGNFWLFGGGNVNDLWEFSPSTKEWTWVGGSNSTSGSAGIFGVYGTLQVPAAGNVPGTRSGAVAWTDTQGNLWLFGGIGEDSSEWSVYLNDLWKYNPSTNEWAWMDGNSSLPYQLVGAAGYNGTLGQPAFGNIPGTRASSAGWTDTHGNFWLFGGAGFGNSLNGGGYLNDLWQFQPYTGGQTQAATPTFSPAPGAYPSSQSVSITTTTPGAIVYYFLNGAPPATQYTSHITISGLDTINAVAEATGYANSTVAQATYVVGTPQASPPTYYPPVVSAGGIYNQPISVFMSSATPNATIYYTTDGSTPTSQSTRYSGAVTVSTAETIKSIATASGYSNSAVSTIFYNVSINPAASPTFNPPPGTYNSPQTVTISDTTPNAVIYYTTDGTLPTTQSTKYTQPISVSSTETIQAIAVAPGGSNSPASFGQYTINLPVPPNTWTYVRGTNTLAQTGTYGSLGNPLAQDYPGSRFGAASWLDSSGNTWILGGKGFGQSIAPQGWLNDLWMYNPGSQIQDGVWTWMGGSNSVDQLGVYGTLGTGSKSNIPGAREGSATWTDQAGNLWLFGGYGSDAGAVGSQLGYRNDLWEYIPSAGTWTWISGSSQGQYLIHAETYGQPGVYGTLGSPTAGSVPGSRSYASTWVDKSGNLWLFGGYGIDAGGFLVLLNDLWKFNPQTVQWIWMGGTPAVTRCYSVFGECGQTGVYGTQGTPSASNVPGGRRSAATWTDKSGNFWLFGGVAIDSSLENGLADNDLWMYSPVSNQWAWMSGSSAFSCPYDPYIGYNVCEPPSSTLATLGVPASGNTPGGRSDLITWIDTTGNLWLFGTGAGGPNDIWVYQTSTGQWAWMGGDYTTSNCSVVFYNGLPPFESCDGNLGVYGPQYIDGVGNVPGARANAVSWTGKGGNFWLFSGAMFDLMTSRGGIGGPVNDLWQFRPSAGTLPPAATPIYSLIPGTYTSGGTLTISNGMSNASIYYTTDGTTPTSSSTVYSGPITFNSSLQVRAIAVAPGYVTSGVAAGDFTLVQQSPPPVFSVAAGTYAGAQTVTLSDATPYYGMIYYTTDGSDPSSSATAQRYTLPLTVSSSETIKAIEAIPGWAVYEGGASTYDGMATPGATLLSPVATATYTINLLQVATPALSVPGGTYTSIQSVTISDSTPGATIYYTTDGTTPSTSSTVYSGAVTVSTTETIKAIATATGFSNSSIATAAYTINLPPPNFTFAIAPTSRTISSGGSGTATLTVTPQNGFNSAVSFACSGLPAGVSCTFNPTTVTPSSSSAVTDTLTFTASSSAQLLPSRAPVLPVSGLTLAVLLFIFRRRRSVTTLLGLVVLAAGFGFMTACGGGSGGGGGGGAGGGGTTSTVTITATSGSIAQTATVTLTVN